MKKEPVSKTSKTTHYFPQLTGIRAIAAYLVYLHHVRIPIAENYQKEFHIGVGVFFVLSGFLIYYRYYHSFKATRIWWAGYIKNRVARIYPVFFLLTILTLLFKGASVRDWVFNLTFAKGFFDGLKFTGIAQGWSLTVEECFYFSAPLIFLMFRRRRIWLPLLGIYMIGVALTLFSQGLSLPLGFFGSFRFTLLYTFLGRAFEFFVGMYLARLYINHTAKAASPAPVRRIPATWIGLVGAAILVSAMVSLQSPDFGYGLFHPAGIFINNVLLPLCYAFLFWGLLTENTWLKNLLGSRLMELLGKASYVFYLIHVGIVRTFVGAILSKLALGYLPRYLIMFIVLNLIAIGIYVFIEDPLNKVIRKSRLLEVSPKPDSSQAFGDNPANLHSE